MAVTIKGFASDWSLPRGAKNSISNHVDTTVRKPASSSSIDGATRKLLAEGTLIDNASSATAWNKFGLNGTTVTAGPDVDPVKGRYLRFTPGPTGSLNRMVRNLTTPVDLSNGFISVPVRVNGTGLSRLDMVLGTRTTDMNSTVQIGSGTNTTSEQLVPGRWNTLTFDPSDAFRYQAPKYDDNNVVLLGFHTATTDGTTTVDFGPIRVHSRANMNKKVIWQFDDGWLDTYTTAFPILQAAGFVGSVPVEIDRVGTTDRLNVAQLQELYDAGWEITGHHSQQIPLMTDAVARVEFQKMKDLNEANGWDRGKNFFVWPGGQWDTAKEEIALEYFTHLRRVTSMQPAPTPWVTNKYAIPLSYVVSNSSLAGVKVNLDKAAESGGCWMGVFHSIRENADSSNWSITNFQGLVDHAQALGFQSTTLTEMYENGI